MKGHSQHMLPPSFMLLLLALLYHCTLFASAHEDSLKEASPILYEKPSLARLSTAASKQLHKECLYNGHKFLSGEEVQTEQPCLRCTCKKGVLLCALRVCPPVAAGNLSTPNSRCQVIREPNTCCPTLHCFTQDDAHTGHRGANEISSNIKSFTTVTPLISLQGSHFISDLDRDGSNRSEDASPVRHMVSVTHLLSRNTTILQTVPSSSYPDKHQNGNYGNSAVVSRLSAHHSQPHKESHVSDKLSTSDKHCYLNGTFYAEGSAIGSSSYCEHCYCIRGRRMCIRPRCHLSILGCLPRYTTEYACCPTSYACGDDALDTFSNNISSNSQEKWPLFYALDEKLKVDSSDSITTTGSSALSVEQDPSTDSPIGAIAEPTIASIEENVQTTTTQTAIEIIEKFPAKISSSSRMTDCILEGVSYKSGDAMPADGNCRHCFCAVDGNRICNAIHCSLQLDHHCTPVIPEGHCCPIEYKCGTKSEPSSTGASSEEVTFPNKNQSQAVSSSFKVVHRSSLPDSLNNSMEKTLDSEKRLTELEATTTPANDQNPTTIKSVDSTEKDDFSALTTEADIKVFRLFAFAEQNNENISASRNTSADLIPDQIELDKFNATNEFEAMPNDSKSSNSLEARNLSDEPKMQANLRAESKPKTEAKRLDSSNSDLGAIKLENVAHFFNNIFSALGLSAKNGIEHGRVQPVREHMQTSTGLIESGAMLPLEQASPLMSLISSDSIERVTALPLSIASENAYFQSSATPSTNSLQSVSPIRTAVVPRHSADSSELVPNLPSEERKSMRELPSDGSSLSKNLALEKSNLKLHTFSNGWRAIPNLKHKTNKPVSHPPTEPSLPMSSRMDQVVSKIDTEEALVTTAKIEASSEEYKQNTDSNQTTANIDIKKAKCLFDGKEYENGAIVPKSSDPCVYCRCFYGEPICQEQKCPLPPSSACKAERVANQCCAVFTCGLTANLTNQSTGDKMQESQLEKSTIRRGPQYQPEIATGNQVGKVQDMQGSTDLMAKSRFQTEQTNGAVVRKAPAPETVAFHGPPMNQPRISFPFDPLPRPLDLAYGSRVHFPPNKQIILPPNLSPGIILNLNKPFIKRPMYGEVSPPHTFKHKFNKVDQLGGGVNVAPIRPLPQSPTQLEKTAAVRPTTPVSIEPVAVSTEQSTTRQQEQPSTTAMPSGPWDILHVSGCNIYGKMYKTGEEIGQLSSDCKKCLCSPQGVQCKQIC